MKHLKYLIARIIITFSISITNGYVFGIKSADNTISNILQIQEKYKLNFDVIGFIFDPWSDNILWTLENLNDSLGTGKIYHITLSPNSYTAQQVSEGIFDNEYRKFFQTIKENNLKVIFRTMHEMNGGWYPRGSNPEEFKKAREHVREISREEGLTQENILFDFSVNHRDMPTKETPSQNAKLITCNKYRTDCYKFEDYYPGDKYVDIVGVTFYNWGKATYSRQWYSPNKILNDTDRNTLTRLKKFNKPIIIDEVGTTAVRYEGIYNFYKSKKIYDNDYSKKNERLSQLNNFMNENPEILGMIYFNTDYTNGLTTWTPGEADRAIINLEKNKIYYGVYDIYKDSGGYNNILGLFKNKKKKYNITNEDKIEFAEILTKYLGKNKAIESVNEIIELNIDKEINEIFTDIKKYITKKTED